MESLSSNYSSIDHGGNLSHKSSNANKIAIAIAAIAAVGAVFAWVAAVTISVQFFYLAVPITCFALLVPFPKVRRVFISNAFAYRPSYAVPLSQQNFRPDPLKQHHGKSTNIRMDRPDPLSSSRSNLRGNSSSGSSMPFGRPDPLSSFGGRPDPLKRR